MLPKKSLEQEKVITHLKQSNVIVNSVAGSGKTTTNLFIAKEFKDSNILLITYNAKLKIETRERVKENEINNLEVHSFHSFCVKYYSRECYTDSGITKVLKKKSNILNNFKYDLIVLDEAQDMSFLYFKLFCKIYIDNKINSKICIFGDKGQSIFEFNNADYRYIELGSTIFKLNNLTWKHCNLSNSYRITDKMSDFINNCLFNYERIKSNKMSEQKPRYIICDTFGDTLFNKCSRTFEEVKYYLNRGYNPSDIFILAYSVKSNKSPIRKLENKIKEELDILVYIPTNDEEKLDKDLLKNKLVFSTFHQTKGLERKVVICFNFDTSYYKYYDRNAPTNYCPNTLYVAATRASECLTIFHDYKNDYLPFLQNELIKKYCYFENDILFITGNKKSNIIDTAVTGLLKFIPIEIIDECYDFLDIKKIKKSKKKIKIPIKIHNIDTDSYEGVSDITGIAIPSIFEYNNNNKMSILTKLSEKDIYKLEGEINESNILEIANKWNSYKTGFKSKVKQIKNYDWLSKKNLAKCLKRLDKLGISKNASFEYEVNCKKKELYNRNLNGFIDCYDKENNKIYEFKCVEELSKEYYLQVAIYMYMIISRTRDIKDINQHKIKNLKKEFEFKKSLYKTQLKNKLKKKEDNLNDLINNICYEKFNGILNLDDEIKFSIFPEKSGIFDGIVKKITKKEIIVHNKEFIKTITKDNILYIKKLLLIENKESKINILRKAIQDIKNTEELKHKDIDSCLLDEIKKLEKEMMIPDFYLFNILTNEMYEIKCNICDLKRIIDILIRAKDTRRKISDCKFIEDNLNYIEKLNKNYTLI